MTLYETASWERARVVDDELHRDVLRLLQETASSGDLHVDGDDPDLDLEVVRAFMLTRGRTRASSMELPIETLVSAPLELEMERRVLDREHRRIRSVLIGPMSIAEVSAHLGIPLRAAVVLTSEMVAAGLLSAGVIADREDTGVLLQIRDALRLL